MTGGCSSSSTVIAMLRMPAKPISATARDTVLMLPPPAWLKCALLTRRSSLLVSATSLRISFERLARLSFSDEAMRWMRAIESDSAGKSLLWRMRRSRNSSVPLPAFAKTPEQSVELLARVGELRALGRPLLVEGDAANLKITWPSDFRLAEALKGSR